MTITANDIKIMLSGGATNTNPNLSLGGSISSYSIVNKRVFDDITPEEAENGMKDFRCLYVKNTSVDSILYNARVYFFYVIPGDVTVQIGFHMLNERQNLIISNGTFITGGSCTLIYVENGNNHEIELEWNESLEIWAENLQDALREIPNLEDITINASESNDNIIFEIDFLGAASSRYHEDIVLATDGNNYVSTETVTIGIVKAVGGGPINQVADSIDIDTTTPNNIVFTPLEFLVGDLRPGDFFPIWIERNVPVNTTPIEDDGFTLRIKGDMTSDE